MKKYITPLILCSCICLWCSKLSAQHRVEQIAVEPAKVVNFKELAEYERLNPPHLEQRYIEQGEDADRNFVFTPKPVPGNAVSFTIDRSREQEKALLNSPATSTSFNGVLDNNTLIPPDIRGAVGPTYILETTNQQFNIYTKTGTLNSTVTITTFFSATGGNGYFDPHCVYDATNGRYIIAMDGNNSDGDGGIFLAVSKTNDPTGAWYVYSFDGIGNKTDFLDYPLLGFNNTWVVVTGNDFIGGNSPVYGKIYVMSRASLYSGTLGTVSTFTDDNAFSLDPAQTYDATQATEYLVQDWNGSSGGSGYMSVSTITGTATAPVYTVAGTIGVNQPWSETALGAKQSGSSNTIETNDTRVGNSVFINGSLWFCNTVYLPSTTPVNSGVDWWQINPASLTVQQFGRIYDASGAMFYYFPSINVNANGDALLGYCQSSSTTYAGAGYSFHAAADAVNTMETGVEYKAGVASYFKEYGGGRNRWGDFTGTAVDPTDNSFWNFSEWANSGNEWGTVIGRVPRSSAPTCNAPTGMNTTAITSTTATFNWTAAAGASSYNIQYRIVGTTTWSTGTSSTTSFNASGLTASNNYEWQVQTVCSGGSSAFTASTDFTTSSANSCNAPTGMNTTAITTTTATFNWTAPTGAVSYNVQYRIVGTTTWSTGTSSTTSFNASGLTAGSNYEWQVQTVCSGGSSAFTASTDFSTTAACGVATGLTAGSLTSTSASLSWTAVSGATSYNLQWKTATGGSFTTVSGLTAPPYSLTGLGACTSYEFQVQSVCSGGSGAYTSATTFSTTGCTVSYCTSTSTNYSYEYIKNVKLGTINNTGTDASGYINYTSVSTNLAGGTSNTITLTPGFSGSSYTEDFTVYIDYNHNGVFTDAGETVAKVSGRSAVSKSFTVPTSALNGSTRMRIQMQYNSYETNSCATFTYGQVQDYTVNITGNAHGPVVAPEEAEESAQTATAENLGSIVLYPNPAQNYITLQVIALADGPGKIAIYNMAGEKLAMEETTVTAGTNTINCNTGKLSDGIYIMEIESRGSVQRARFVISR